MFLSKKYCFANESEARSGLSGPMLQLTMDDLGLFDKDLPAIFSVRGELFDLVNRSVQAKEGQSLRAFLIFAFLLAKTMYFPLFRHRE